MADTSLIATGIGLASTASFVLGGLFSIVAIAFSSSSGPQQHRDLRLYRSGRVFGGYPGGGHRREDFSHGWHNEGRLHMPALNKRYFSIGAYQVKGYGGRDYRRNGQSGGRNYFGGSNGGWSSELPFDYNRYHKNLFNIVHKFKLRNYDKEHYSSEMGGYKGTKYSDGNFTGKYKGRNHGREGHGSNQKVSRYKSNHPNTQNEVAYGIANGDTINSAEFSHPKAKSLATTRDIHYK